MVNDNLTKRRLFKICLFTIFALVVSYFAFCTYFQWATFYHPITAEGRILGKPITAEGRILGRSGNIFFFSLPGIRGEERRAVRWAVFRSSALWPRHIVYSGNRTYAFAPFSRVYALVRALDAYDVVSISHWSGSPRDYPFPEDPTDQHWVARTTPPKR